MRKNLVSNVLRASAFATACLALAGSNASAAAVITANPVPVPPMGTQYYSTSEVSSGSFTSGISTPGGGTPTNAISFTPVVNNYFDGTSAVSLGQFQVATLPAGQETDYKNTPFTITYNPVNYSTGTAVMPYTTGPVTISGVLNGSITGSTSNVVATFNAISSPAFASPDGSSLSTVSVLNSPLALVAPSAGGITTVQAGVMTTSPSAAGTGGTNTPEPTTLAILATALVGLGLRKQLRKVRQAD